MIHLLTGNGGGKTTSALGLVIRALGHKKNVVIVQFMKGRSTGEYEFLKDKCIIRQFGSKSFVNLDKPSLRDKKLAEEGLKFAFESLDKNPFLIVLDEINLACAIGLLNISEVVSFLKKAKNINVVLTGRYAPKELVKAAHIVTELTDITPPKRRMPAKKGLEY